MNFLLYFLITFFIEVTIFFVYFRKHYLRILFFVFLINAFSWPLANLFYDFYNSLLIIETFVFIIEGFLILLLFKLRHYKAFTLSLIANVLSFGVGLLL